MSKAVLYFNSQFGIGLTKPKNTSRKKHTFKFGDFHWLGIFESE
jgi:hypothetical protein